MTDHNKVNVVDEVKVDKKDLKGPNDLTLQQEAFLLHLMRVKQLKKELEKEAAELKTRQQTIKALHEIMQEINNYIDSSGGLDITKNDDLQKKIKHAAEKFGVKLPTDKVKFDSHETKRLLDNLHYSVEDMEKEDNIQMRKIQSLYTESEQSIMIAKNTMQSIDKPIRAMIAGIKGS